MTKKRAPRHLADAKGAGKMVFGDRGHLTQNVTGSKSPRPRVAEGDVIHVITTQPGDLWWWIVVPPGQSSAAVIQCGTGLCGTFRTQQEAEADLGPDCAVRDGGRWDSAWGTEQ
jgi:hypothetical protein